MSTTEITTTVEDIVYDRCGDGAVVTAAGFVNGGITAHTATQGRPWCTFRLYGARKLIEVDLLPGRYRQYRAMIDPVRGGRGGLHPALVAVTGTVWQAAETRLTAIAVERLPLPADIEPGANMRQVLQNLLEAPNG